VRVSSPVLRGPGGEIPPGYLPFVLQDVIPNHHKLLWSKAIVVNVMGKGEAVTSSGVC
jgi:hypothetical protein